MNGLASGVGVDDLLVLLVTLQGKPIWSSADFVRVRAEATALVDLLEQVVPKTDRISVGIAVARSRLLMGRLWYALDRVEQLLSDCERLELGAVDE